MKHISPRILFSPSLLVARFSTSGGHHFPRRHDEVWRNVRVCVWWDFENCHVPSGVNVFRVGQAITAALRANGIKGPVQITAFGDVMQLSRANQEALSATGITLTHIPYGGKNSSDRSLLVDLMCWVSQNPPPAHLFLISGDRDFAGILHRLRMSNYNILLATKSNASGVLCSAASIMWNWNSLLKMEGLKGTHFNLPPDGLYGSWYGDSKVPLENPFAGIEEPTCSLRENSSASSSELQVRPIPEAVQRQIRDILNLHPDGISVSDFGNELKRKGVILDKDLYGCKKLSRFLLSMRDVLELQTLSDGQHIIRGIFAKSLEPFVPSESSVTKNQLLAKSSKANGKDASISQPVDVKTPLPPSSKEHLRKIEKNQPPVADEGNGKDASISQPVDVKISLPPSWKEHLRKIEKHEPPVAEQANGKDASISEPVDVKTSLPPSWKEHLRKIEKYQPPVAEQAATVDRKPLERAEQPSLVCENVDLVNAQFGDCSVKDRDVTSEVGSFKNWLQKILFGEGVDFTEIKSSDIAKEGQISRDIYDQRALSVREKCIASGDSAGNEAKVNDLKSPVKDIYVTSKVGSFKNWLQKILFGGVDITEFRSSHIATEAQTSGDISDQITLAVGEKCVSSGDSAGNEAKVNDMKSSAKGSDSVELASCSVTSVEPILESKTAFDSDAYEKKSGKTLGLFSRVFNWFKNKSSGSNSQRSSDEPSQELEHTNRTSGKHQLFAEDSFWKDLESFMDTKNALLIISKSMTRQQIAQNLRKEGPLVLRTLKESDILELIDMLISEKKWVEECPSEASTFKLTRCVGSHTSFTAGSPSNGLRSLFLTEHAKPNLKSGDNRIQNVSHTGVTGKLVASNRTHLGRTKKEVLNDCHKLANEIVEEFPEGYNIGSFRKLFLEKYGYHLDIRKLGYEKLACLLQTIPGLRIESSTIIPTRKALKSEGQVTAVSDNPKTVTNQESHVAAVTIHDSQGTAVSDNITSQESREPDRESSDASEKDDEQDSLFDELGPVAKIDSKRIELESSLREMGRKDTPLQIHADSDGEYTGASQKKEQNLQSSLLKFLHSIDDDADEGNDKKRGKSEDGQGEADSDINCLETGNPCERATKLRDSSGNYAMKQKSQKHYSFVADTSGSTLDKLYETDHGTDKTRSIVCSMLSKKF